MDQTMLLLVLIVGMVGFMFYSQWRSRKKYQQKMEQMQVGDRVVTIGGLYGKLTYLDRETNRARLEVAPNVELEFSLGAISQRVSQPGEE